MAEPSRRNSGFGDGSLMAGVVEAMIFSIMRRCRWAQSTGDDHFGPFMCSAMA